MRINYNEAVSRERFYPQIHQTVLSNSLNFNKSPSRLGAAAIAEQG